MSNFARTEEREARVCKQRVVSEPSATLQDTSPQHTLETHLQHLLGQKEKGGLRVQAACGAWAVSKLRQRLRQHTLEAHSQQIDPMSSVAKTQEREARVCKQHVVHGPSATTNRQPSSTPWQHTCSNLIPRQASPRQKKKERLACASRMWCMGRLQQQMTDLAAHPGSTPAAI
jgi:hypothetical protein